MLSSPVFIYTGLSTLYLFVVGKGVEEVVYRCTTMTKKSTATLTALFADNTECGTLLPAAS
jgi:hypothetical protein